VQALRVAHCSAAGRFSLCGKDGSKSESGGAAGFPSNLMPLLPALRRRGEADFLCLVSMARVEAFRYARKWVIRLLRRNVTASDMIS
jgi:hypothetical protein